MNMKNLMIALLSSFVLFSCDDNKTKPIEATYDPVGIDSSNILPPLVDTVKIEPNDTPHGIDSIKAVD